MTKRGKVLRDTLAGSGLLMVEGRQFQFVLDGMWKSDVLPKAGMVVDIEFDLHGQITEISAISDSQLAKECAGDGMVPGRRRTGAQVVSKLAQSGRAELTAGALLILSWFFLTAISVEVPLTGSVELTFWQVLHALGSEAYVLPGLMAVAGAFVHHFWKDRHASLGGLLPLGFIVLVFLALFRNSDVLADPGGRLYPVPRNQAREAISFGLGTYLSVIISAYFACLSIRQFRHGQGNQKRVSGELHKAAA